MRACSGEGEREHGRVGLMCEYACAWGVGGGAWGRTMAAILPLSSSCNTAVVHECKKSGVALAATPDSAVCRLHSRGTAC